MKLRSSGILLLLFVLTLPACTSETVDSHSPGTIVAEGIAPDSSVRATVVAGDENGDYLVRLHHIESEEVIAEGKVLVPDGYHSHHISLGWSANADTVIATIDHDFGDNNIVYRLAR